MPDLERIQQLTPGTLSQQWYEDGAAVDPGTVTVGITRADGTVLVAAGSSTAGTGTAARTFNLTTTHTALLDRLRVTWTSTLKGTLVSYVEVVGGFLFSIADARALKPLDSAVSYPTSQIVSTRLLAEQALEDACGVAFVPRYTYETVDGTGNWQLVTRWPKVTTIRSATVRSYGTVTTLAASDIALLTYGGASTGGYGWPCGVGNVTVGYEHGYSAPPERVRRACLLLARNWLVTGPIDDRASTFSSADGGTFAMVTPGRGGSIFGIPEVDVVVQQYGMTVGML
jgi:hypothetical protein